MERRITYFVELAERTDTGWRIAGEVGLGPIELGDTFTFVNHQDVPEEDAVSLRVEALDSSGLTVAGSRDFDIRAGDILGGENAR